MFCQNPQNVEQHKITEQHVIETSSPPEHEEKWNRKKAKSERRVKPISLISILLFTLIGKKSTFIGVFYLSEQYIKNINLIVENKIKINFSYTLQKRNGCAILVELLCSACYQTT